MTKKIIFNLYIVNDRYFSNLALIKLFLSRISTRNPSKGEILFLKIFWKLWKRIIACQEVLMLKYGKCGDNESNHCVFVLGENRCHVFSYTLRIENDVREFGPFYIKLRCHVVFFVIWVICNEHRLCLAFSFWCEFSTYTIGIKYEMNFGNDRFEN